jgi:hypothetical protein
MKWLFSFLVFALLSQIALFFYSRKLKKELKNNVIDRYNLKTPKDAWNALADPSINEEDKEKIRKYYNGKE